jgi:hypothetical protein
MKIYIYIYQNGKFKIIPLNSLRANAAFSIVLLLDEFTIWHFDKNTVVLYVHSFALCVF